MTSDNTSPMPQPAGPPRDEIVTLDELGGHTRGASHIEGRAGPVGDHDDDGNVALEDRAQVGSAS